MHRAAEGLTGMKLELLRTEAELHVFVHLP